MTTEELIKFLIETEFINYAEDYEIIDEITKKLKKHKGAMELHQWLFCPFCSKKLPRIKEE